MNRLAITQVSPFDVGGGAEAIALDLHRQLRARGHDALLAVGRATTVEPGIIQIDHAEAARGPARAGWLLHRRLERQRRWRAARLARALAEPGTLLDLVRGHEDFRFPGSYGLERLVPQAPDVVHVHNLHGGYFDPRVLGPLSHRVPVVATIHDAWLFTGHCAHPLDSDGWRRGCGNCPHLSTYPALRVDGTAFNLARKREIYRRSRLTVIAPSAWLVGMARASVLAEAMVAEHVIPNGVDTTLFSPRTGGAARDRWRLGRDDFVLAFSAAGGRSNTWKDYETLRSALELVASDQRSTTLLVLGERGPPESMGSVSVVPAGVLRREEVAECLTAADVYVHPARADTFPMTVLEALATGLPVVATAIGGIPEQVVPVGLPSATGVLVAPRSAPELAAAIRLVRNDVELRAALGAAARADAVRRFDVHRMVSGYEQVYRLAIEDHVRGGHGVSSRSR